MQKILKAIIIILTPVLLFQASSRPVLAFLVDHNAVEADRIPQSWLDQARALDTLFTHKSIGNNIMDGIADLQNQNSTRYRIDREYNASASWFDTHNGLIYRTDGYGTNFNPASKISGFNNLIRNNGFGFRADVAMMKFCVVDFICHDWWGNMPAAQVWEQYRSAMESLEQSYPNVIFVWWTSPLNTTDCNSEKTIFNNSVRNYCLSHGCVLFDIADIESHDPNGNLITKDGHEAMWGGYSSDSTHLNETGRQRVARALWWLLSRIAGWQPDGGGTTPTPTPTPIPTPTPTCAGPGDVDCDGGVDKDDVLMVLSNFGKNPSQVPGYHDPVGDGKINGVDLGWVIRDWGRTN